MPIFVMLTRLSPEAVRSPAALEQLERQAMDRVRQQCPGVEWLGSYAILGPCDYLDIFRAPDIETAARVLDAGPDLRSRSDGDLDRDGMEPLQGAGPKPVGARLSGPRRDCVPGQDDRVNGAERAASLSTPRMALIASAMRDGSMSSFEKGAAP